MRSTTARRYRLPIAALATIAVAGCAPGASHRASVSMEGPVHTNPTTMGNITLTEWDNRTVTAQSAAQNTLNAAFEAKYPNIKINRVSKNFNDLKTTLKLALSSSTPPDVVQVNQGYSDLAAFVHAGLLRPQDNYARAYGWTARYNPSLLAQNRATADGRSWGTGQLYGISNVAELVGVYYNKAELNRLGLQPPKTLADLEADLPKAKAAGMLPIQLGTSNKSAAIHIFGMLQAILAGPTEVNNLVFGRGSVRWTDPSTLAAATTLQSWAKRGYLSPGANGQTDQDMADAFGKGKGVFMIDGMWWAPQEQASLGSKVGFTVLSKDAGGKPATEGGLSLLWGITSGSKHPDAAAAYINFINSPRAEDIIAKSGDNPAVPPATYTPPAGSVQADVTSSLQQVVKDGTLLPYIDYATVGMYDVAGANLQELIGGQVSPNGFTQALQNEYATAKASR